MDDPYAPARDALDGDGLASGAADADPLASFVDVLAVVDGIEAILGSGAHESYATGEGGVT